MTAPPLPGLLGADGLQSPVVGMGRLLFRLVALAVLAGSVVVGTTPAGAHTSESSKGSPAVSTIT